MPLLEDTATPVVVLDCFWHGGLAIVRSLGRLGVPVYAVHENRWAPGLFSRYCREGFVWNLRASSPAQSMLFLDQLGTRIGCRSVLIPTSDVAAMFVAEWAERLSKWFIFPEQNYGLVRSLCDKKQMYYLAKKWSVPTPETAFPRSKTDVIKYLASARLPVLLKPIYGKLPGRAVPPMEIVHTKQVLLERYDSIEEPSAPNLMLQEYIPGADEMTWTFNGYFDRSGGCKVAFTGRKLRNYPAYFGQASLGICTQNDDVAGRTIEFMTAIGYRGPLDIGYRYDVRDGQYKVNDINPRIGAMFRLFVGANGMDVARALYQDMTGQLIHPAGTLEGRKWIVEDRDWVSALRYCRDGKLTLKGWRNSVRGVQETSYLAKDDPWPVIGAVANDLRSVINGWLPTRPTPVSPSQRAQINT